MDNTKYIGMDVHKEATTIAVMNSAGKLVMESIVETKAATMVQFFEGLRGQLYVTLEEGTWAAWLYDLLKPHFYRTSGQRVIRSGSSGAGKSTSRQTVKLGFVNAKALCVNATGSCPVTVGRDLAGTQRLVAAETFHPCAVRAGHHLSWN